MVEVVKRRYDATNRRALAVDTQRRILDAARDLFARDGYANTTMTAIATHAGVASQTVYASARSKRDILKLLLDLAVSGPEAVPVAASDEWRTLDAEPDPQVKLRRFVTLHTRICVQEAPILSIAAEAAGADLEIRELVQSNTRRRYADQRRLAASMARKGHLRPGLSTSRAADIIWTLASEQVFLALCSERGWTSAAFEEWLTDQLVHALLPAQV